MSESVHMCTCMYEDGEGETKRKSERREGEGREREKEWVRERENIMLEPEWEMGLGNYLLNLK